MAAKMMTTQSKDAKFGFLMGIIFSCIEKKLTASMKGVRYFCDDGI